MKNTHYAWVAMKDGELQQGMYTVSDASASPEVARQLARPSGRDTDAYALCSIDTDGERMLRRTILEIEPIGSPASTPVPVVKKWNVAIGDRREAISADLLTELGFQDPYSNDETNTARSGEYVHSLLAEARAHGLRGDEGAAFAIRLRNERRAATEAEMARTKTAESYAKAAADYRAAEGMATARKRSHAG